jgi:hypothetical protein
MRIRTIATAGAITLTGLLVGKLFREYFTVLTERDLYRFHAKCLGNEQQLTVDEIRGYADTGGNNVQVFGPNGQDAFELRLLDTGLIEISHMPREFSFKDIVTIFEGTYVSTEGTDNGKIILENTRSAGPNFDLKFIARTLATAVREHQACRLEQMRAKAKAE